MSNLQVLDILDFLQARPLDQAAHALNNGTVQKKDWRFIYSFRYVGEPHPPLNPSN